MTEKEWQRIGEALDDARYLRWWYGGDLMLAWFGGSLVQIIDSTGEYVDAFDLGKQDSSKVTVQEVAQACTDWINNQG